MTALQRRRFITFTGAVSSVRMSKRDSADNMVASRHQGTTRSKSSYGTGGVAKQLETRSLSENTEHFNILARFLNNFSSFSFGHRSSAFCFWPGLCCGSLRCSARSIVGWGWGRPPFPSPGRLLIRRFASYSLHIPDYMLRTLCQKILTTPFYGTDDGSLVNVGLDFQITPYCQCQTSSNPTSLSKPSWLNGWIKYVIIPHKSHTLEFRICLCSESDIPIITVIFMFQAKAIIANKGVHIGLVNGCRRRIIIWIIWTILQSHVAQTTDNAFYTPSTKAMTKDDNNIYELCSDLMMINSYAHCKVLTA